MQSSDHTQDPRPGENDDETAGPERRKGGASHKPMTTFTPHSTDEPADRDADEPYPPKIGPPPMT